MDFVKETKKIIAPEKYRGCIIWGGKDKCHWANKTGTREEMEREIDKAISILNNSITQKSKV